MSSTHFHRIVLWHGIFLSRTWLIRIADRQNFTGFPEIEGSVSYFWKVAAPSTVVFFLIFSFSYLRSGFETTLRKLGRWRRTRMVEKNLRQRQSQAKVPQ